MKKILIILLTLTTTYFFSCYLYEIHQINQKIAFLERVDYLENKGYTTTAAEHIAKVEFKLIPDDAEYIALMED